MQLRMKNFEKWTKFKDPKESKLQNQTFEPKVSWKSKSESETGWKGEILGSPKRSGENQEENQSQNQKVIQSQNQDESQWRIKRDRPTSSASEQVAISHQFERLLAKSVMCG